jgi:hypothetical protein
MSDVRELERSYRRWLRYYPRSFREEHEEEMLTILVASVAPGRRRPEAMECLDLLVSALVVWVRPRIPRSDRSTRLAVRLMLLGAAVELAVSLIVWATLGEVRAAIVARNPGYTSGQWHAEVGGTLEPLAIAAGAFVVVWLWMAWANGRGRRWAKIVFTLLLVETTFSLLHGLYQGSATYAPQDLAAGVLLWIVELSAVIVLCHGELRRRVAAQSLSVTTLPRLALPADEGGSSSDRRNT